MFLVHFQCVYTAPNRGMQWLAKWQANDMSIMCDKLGNNNLNDRLYFVPISSRAKCVIKLSVQLQHNLNLIYINCE